MSFWKRIESWLDAWKPSQAVVLGLILAGLLVLAYLMKL